MYNATTDTIPLIRGHDYLLASCAVNNQISSLRSNYSSKHNSCFNREMHPFVNHDLITKSYLFVTIFRMILQIFIRLVCKSVR